MFKVKGKQQQDKKKQKKTLKQKKISSTLVLCYV